MYSFLPAIQVNRSSSAILLIFSAILYCWLGYFVPREQFWLSLFGFSILFVCYLLLLRSTISLRALAVLGICFRVLLLFSIPWLSDDFYRFLWDGKLLLDGFNPFLYTPTEFLEVLPQAAANKSFYEGVYGYLNSPDYYTIYPPLNQAVFFTAAQQIDENNLYGGVLILRIFIILSEIVTIIILPRLLQRLNIEPKAALIYVLNPLVIVELTGNLHFEAMLICFLLLSFDQLFFRKKLLIAAFFFSLAIASKLLPLMLLPLFFRRLGYKKAIFFYFLIGLFCLGWFFPFIEMSLAKNLFSSIKLYFQKFEFNASVFYVVRWIGFKLYGYNTIETSGVRLSWIVAAFTVLISSLKQRNLSVFFNRILFVFSVYFFLATIIHPWYISTLVVLSVLTPIRFPLVWSFFAFLSYATYTTNSYEQPMGLITMEYFFTYLWLLVELKRLYGVIIVQKLNRILFIIEQKFKILFGNN